MIGPKGCVSIVDQSGDELAGDSDDVDGHSKTGSLKVHYGELGSDGKFVKKDQFIDTSDEPDHDGLCLLEQKFLLKAIKEDLSLEDHLRDAVNSLRIVLAADESFKTGKTIEL